MSRARKLLIVSGLALALWGMGYGLVYAVFIEHQTLDAIGGSLQNGFISAAGRRMPEAHAAISSYAQAKFNYVRQVDVHSHWIGLGMVLIVLGVVFDSVGFAPRTQTWLAAGLVIGAAIFPLGVILQTTHIGPLASALAVAGSGLVITALAAIAFGLLRNRELPAL